MDPNKLYVANISADTTREPRAEARGRPRPGDPLVECDRGEHGRSHSRR